MEYRRTIILLAFMCASIQGYEQDAETLRKVLPGYAITVGIDQLNSTRCRTEMEEFRDSVDRGVLWSLRTLDSSGEPSPGFISGNNLWMGSRPQCENLNQKIPMPVSEQKRRNNSIYRNPAEEFPPFRVNFFSVHLAENGTLQYHVGLSEEETVVLGLCLPLSCTEHEVTTMLNKVFDDKLLLVGQLYSTDFKVIKVSNLRNDYKWLLDPKIIVILFILAALFGIVIAGTLYDCLIYQKHLRREKEFLAYENNNTSELKNEMEGKEEHEQEDDAPTEIKPDSGFARILLCFSAYSNIKQLFRVDNSTESILAFHGLKFFGMLWIIVAHTVFYSLNLIGNKVEGFLMSVYVENQILANATLSVDTYLFISGFLLTFTYMKAMKRENKVLSLSKNASNFVSAMVKRYIRLTPAYAVTIMLVIVNFSWHAQFSMVPFLEPLHELCSKYWWRNLLYINNLFEWDELCLSWSWYVSIDMQFYTFGSLLMILLSTRYYLAVGIGVLALLFTTFVRAYVTYSTGYIPTLDTQLDTLSYMYMRPWMRIQPYLVGMATALILKKLNYKLHLSKKTLTGCWCISILSVCAILFGLAERNISLGSSVLYEMFSRLGWSIGIAWLVIACLTNNAGIVGKFLSLSYWVPFSRIILCAYLLNPFVVISLAMWSSYPFQVDMLTTAIMGLGVIVATFVCAFGLSIVAEVPIVLLFRYVSIFNRRMK